MLRPMQNTHLLAGGGPGNNQQPDPRQWRARADELARKAEAAGVGASADVLRAAAGLLALAPWGMVCRLPAPAALEALLAARAYASAALALLPADAAYMLSCGGGEGGCIATVLLPGMAEEVTMPGGSAALALVAALLAGLAGMAADAKREPAPHWLH